MPYLHGAYAQYEQSGLNVPAQSGTLPVYFGVAPVHQLPDYTGTAATPILLNTPAQMRQLLGYSDDWANFSLAEPCYVHFLSAEPVAPIVVVNIMDPDVHKATSETTASVTFANGRAAIKTSTAIVATVEVTDAPDTAQIDVSYDETGTSLLLVDTTGQMSGPFTVTYFDVNASAITPESVAAMIMDAMPKVYEIAAAIPNVLAAPGWSDVKAVNDALKNAAQKINGHWNAFVFGDISATAVTAADAIALKAAELRNAAIESPCWPMATDGQRYYHLSTLAAAKSQIVDQQNGDVPFETVSNKSIAVTGLVVSDGAGGYAPVFLDQLGGNDLNAKGIKTAIFWGGGYRLWGPHTGSYDYTAGNIPEEIFDCGVRMTQYIGNDFQRRYGDVVDKPMHRARIDQILNAEQEWLDNLVNRGALLYGAVNFIPDNNPINDLMTGEFVFDTQYTTTPPARAIINRYRYTATGLELLTGGVENG